jgi:hypothetical protein
MNSKQINNVDAQTLLFIGYLQIKIQLKTNINKKLPPPA